MNEPGAKSKTCLIYFGLILGTLLLYGKVARFDFSILDDYTYVHNNPHIQKGVTLHGLGWAMTSSYAGNWHPLTWVSHMIDCQIYGANVASGHHVTNVLFHVANTLLLFILLRRMTGTVWRSALVAALFAWHPAHVESVAWIAERKDVLSAFFSFLTLLAYERYVRTQEAATNPRKYYYWTILLFALAILSKPMAVTLPFLMLVLDLWPLNRLTFRSESAATENFVSRLKKLTLEKWPLFAISFADCIITLVVQKKSGAVMSVQALSLADRVANTFVNYCRYLGELFYPVDLAILYPLNAQHSTLAIVLGAILLLAAISAASVWLFRKRPWVLAGWLWFLGTLVPVIGLVQVGSQTIADRYTYIPFIGLFIALVWELEAVTRNWLERKPSMAAGAGIILVTCIAMSSAQLAFWKNARVLFEHAIAVAGDSFLAQNTLGLYYDEHGQHDESMLHFKRSLELDTNTWNRWHLIAQHEAKMGNYATAVQYYEEELKNGPGDAVVLYNYANALAGAGKFAEAITQYRKSIALDPDDPRTHNNLGGILLHEGRTEDAMDEFKAALKIDSELVQPQEQLGEIFMKKGDVKQALLHLQEAVRIDPKLVRARVQYAIALASMASMNEAIEQLEAALAIEPGNGEAHFNLGACYEAQNNLKLAGQHFATALKINPGDFDAAKRTATTLAKLGGWKDAIKVYHTALNIRTNSTSAMMELAGLLLSCPDKSLRDPAAALELAKNADALTGHKNPAVLSVIDMALASSGQFEDAEKAAESTAALADSVGNKGEAERARIRIELYRQKKTMFD